MLVSPLLLRCKSWALFGCGALIGLLAFISIYGISVLDVTYDAWIFRGYDEYDIIQHYTGWLSFRESDWVFPFGYTNGIAYPTGTIISFTDSLPWISIFFKALSPILPETFQFFGIFILSCFLLQGGFAALLLHHFCKQWHLVLLGIPFFVFAPVLLDRAFRHTALASHWLILAALLLYFKKRRLRPTLTLHLYFGLLTVYALGIHPYFLPMIYGIYFFLLVEQTLASPIKWRCALRQAAALAINLAITLGCGVGIGLIGRVVSNRAGYGDYAMNLNALFNPTTVGGYLWSIVLPVRGQTSGQYDGFNYLGLGILLGICGLFLWVLLTRKKENWAGICQIISRNRFLCLLCAMFTLFAVSNTIGFDEWSITVPLPSFLLSFGNYFRASSRIFYPVYYLIFLAVLIALYRVLKGKWRTIAVCGLLLVQLADLSPALLAKHQKFSTSEVDTPFEIFAASLPGASVYDSALLADDALREKVAAYTYLYVLEPGNDNRAAAFAAKNHLLTNLVIANTGEYVDANTVVEIVFSQLFAGTIVADTCYMTTNYDLITQALAAYGENPPFELYTVADTYYFILPY